MSQHKDQSDAGLIEALKQHRLPHDTPSQLADAFRNGYRAALARTHQPEAAQHKQGCDALGGYGHGIGPCSCGAQQPAQVVPDGWRLVPVEPTIAMLMAGDDARYSVEHPTKAHAVYCAMLAASQHGEGDK